MDRRSLAPYSSQGHGVEPTTEVEAYAHTYTGNFSHDQRLFLPGRVLQLSRRSDLTLQAFCPMFQSTSTHPILCFFMLHPPMGLTAWIYYLLGCLVKESFPWDWSAGHKCQGGRMGQVYRHVCAILLWAGQPHLNSVFNLRGHKWNCLSHWDTEIRMRAC